MSEKAIELARAGRAQAEADFIEELAIPSVGTLSRHARDTIGMEARAVDDVRRVHGGRAGDDSPAAGDPV